MYARTLARSIQTISRNFPVLMLTGPRQVGKTTLLELCAAAESPAPRNYVSLDDLDARALAQSDPALFLQTWPAPVTIDEVQYAPQLFSAIKLHVDRHKVNGEFWLTGSQKFELMKGITESLAGRVAIVDLQGLSQGELLGRADEVQAFLPTAEWISHARACATPTTLPDVFQRIWLGAYPKLHAQGGEARDLFFRSYIQTYIQRDVQDTLKVSDQTAFNRFLTAAAARTGQLLNYASLARDVDIDNKTAKAWLSVLETSGLIYLMQPWHTNLSKRVVKSPKLYFLDTGLAAYLTRWPDAESLQNGAMSGAMLETWVVSEVLKSYWHNGQEAPVYFYRDSDMQETDLLFDTGGMLYPVEIKKTASPSRTSKSHFHMLEKIGKPIGPGAVMCFVERDIPLTSAVTAIPIGYL